MTPSIVCPLCQQLLSNLPSVSEKTQCLHCGATIKLKRRSQPTPFPTIPDSPTPNSQANTGPTSESINPNRSGGSRAARLLMYWGTGTVLLLIVAIAVSMMVHHNRTAPLADSNKRKDDNANVVLPQKRDEPQLHSAKPTKPQLSPESKLAVARGVEYLKKRILNSDNEQLYYMRQGKVTRGNWHIGAMALAGLTLLECGVSPQDAAVQKAATEVRRHVVKLHGTYSISTAIWFLNKLHQVKVAQRQDRNHIRSLAARLLAYQRGNGLWGYDTAPLNSTKEEREILTKNRNGRFSLHRDGYCNRSNSQFAALALWIARKYDVPVRHALLAVAENTRDNTHQDGGWVYNTNNPEQGGYTTNTCAGLIFLALGAAVADTQQDSVPKTQHLLRDPVVIKALTVIAKDVGKPTLPQQIQKAYLAALSEWHAKEKAIVLGKASPPNNGPYAPVVGINKHGGDVHYLPGVHLGIRGGDLYFLWSVERMAVIYDLKTIHGEDWYKWGSKIIVSTQLQDGRWENDYLSVPDTCFALLFLTHANIVEDLTDQLRTLQSLKRKQGQLPAQPKTPPTRN